MVDATGHPGMGLGWRFSDRWSACRSEFQVVLGGTGPGPRRTSRCANCAGVHGSGAGVLLNGWAQDKTAQDKTAQDETSGWWPRSVEATRAGIVTPGWTRVRRVRRPVRELSRSTTGWGLIRTTRRSPRSDLPSPVTTGAGTGAFETPSRWRPSWCLDLA